MNVLLYTKDTLTITLITETLSSWGYKVSTCSGKIADLNLVEHDAQIVFLDMRELKESGINNCQLLKKSLYPKYCHIILVGDKESSKDIRQTFEFGADDFLLKPINQNELWVRITLANRFIKLESHSKQLSSKLIEGASDEQLVMTEVKKLWERSKRDFSPLSILHFDISRSNYSDEHLALKMLHEEISKELRAYDYVGKLSNSEIIVTLPSSLPDSAVKAAERIKENCVEKSLLIHVGVSSFNENQKNFKDLLNSAKKALLKSKSNTNNTIVFEA